MAPSKEMVEFFDQCLRRGIRLSALSDFYILYTLKKVETKKGSARKLGMSLRGFKRRLSKLANMGDGQVAHENKAA